MQYKRRENMSIVITGTPGVGKHTITNIVSKKTNLRILDITQAARNSSHIENNSGIDEIDVEKLGNYIEGRASKENLVVGHLAPYVLSKKNVKWAIILRRNPYDLIEVYKERGYSEKKIKENAGSEVLGIIAYDTMNKFQEKAVQLDVSKKTTDQVTDEVFKIISGEKRTEEVDWLEEITNNNDLKKFFDD